MYRIILPTGVEGNVGDLDTLRELADSGAIHAGTPIHDTVSGRTFAAGEHPFLSGRLRPPPMPPQPAYSDSAPVSDTLRHPPNLLGICAMWVLLLSGAGIASQVSPLMIILGWGMTLTSGIIASHLVGTKSNANRINGAVVLSIGAISLVVGVAQSLNGFTQLAAATPTPRPTLQPGSTPFN